MEMEQRLIGRERYLLPLDIRSQWRVDSISASRRALILRRYREYVRPRKRGSYSPVAKTTVRFESLRQPLVSEEAKRLRAQCQSGVITRETKAAQVLAHELLY